MATPSVVYDVVRELSRRSSRKANIVLSGVKKSLISDADIVKRLLFDELRIDATVTQCTRLGRDDSNRPQLLLATLASEHDASAAIRSATTLRKSTSPDVRNSVFLNADLTSEQRSADYKLRAELKLRRAAGEIGLVIRDSRIVTKPAPRSAPHAAAAVPTAAAAAAVVPIAAAAAALP